MAAAAADPTDAGHQDLGIAPYLTVPDLQAL
jgi:hypothetical protein